MTDQQTTRPRYEETRDRNARRRAVRRQSARGRARRQKYIATRRSTR